jgi:6-phospho-3-hexuloisomerase
MAEGSFQALSRRIIEEVSQALADVQPAQVAALGEAIVGASRVFVGGAGRSGLVGRCFAVRLVQLGFPVHVVGAATTPAIAASDLLVMVSASGETDTTCLLARKATAAGARVAALTAARHSLLAAGTDLAVIIPATGSCQYGGSLFEQCALLVLDSVALDLQHRRGQTPDQMDARHANLE